VAEDRHPVALADPEGHEARGELLHRRPELVGGDGTPRPVLLVLEVLRLPVRVHGVVEEVAYGAGRHQRPPRPAATAASAGREGADRRDAAAPRRKRSTTGIASGGRADALPPRIPALTLSST